MKISGIRRMLIVGVLLIGAAGGACAETFVGNLPEMTQSLQFLLAHQPIQDLPSDYGVAGGRQLRIPAGRAPLIDGVSSPGEWDDAGTATIQVRPGWTVTARYKSDETNLYFAFFNLASPEGKEFRFPEVLLDVKNEKSAVWTDNQWWFHGSFTDCQARGKFNDYSSCLKVAKDWESSNYLATDHAPPVIEMKIPYATIGLAPAKAEAIGIAFDVTDTRKEWKFWPADADMTKPSTWGTASPVPAAQRLSTSNLVVEHGEVRL